ncbi:hypothetical protein [Paenibacillus sp. WLX2291]|uniref:hypothetical protein n=1 Tax=Paenibacillus sp. WLX2291 TaxID=3296934 RepID=UPI003983E21E
MENSEYRYTTTDAELEQLDFHDAVVLEVRQQGGNVVLLLEWSILERDHPLNPYPNAQYTGACRLTFYNVRFSQAKQHEKDQDLDVDPQRWRGFEILKLERKTVEGYEGFDLFVMVDTFCSWRLDADGFVLEWNELTGKAWFEE